MLHGQFTWMPNGVSSPARRRRRHQKLRKRNLKCQRLKRLCMSGLQNWKKNMQRSGFFSALESFRVNSYLQVFDKYRRSLADFENLRNRMNKQVSDAKIFGIQGFCKVCIIMPLNSFHPVCRPVWFPATADRVRLIDCLRLPTICL